MSLFESIGGDHKLTPLVLKQRLLLCWFVFTFTGIIWSWIATLFIAFSSCIAATIIACYLAYIWGPGKKAAESMSWEPRWKRLGAWQLFSRYFNARLIKSADLDPSGNYMFAMMPHGIGAISGWTHFCTEATGFSEAFPGINVRALTLEHNFNAPLIREYALMHGLRSVNKRSITNLLSSGPGASVMLVPGGASESLLAAPGTMDLVTARRKGFIRVALSTGAAIVPVMAFGENELFDTYIPVPGSTTHQVLTVLKKIFGFAIPLFWGFGLLGGSGLIPYNRQLTTVIGQPIQLPKYVSGMSYEEAVGADPDSDADSASASGALSGDTSRAPPGPAVKSMSSTDSTQGDDGNRSKSKTSAWNDPVFHALVDKYHADFMAATQALYDTHKDLHSLAAERVRELRFA